MKKRIPTEIIPSIELAQLTPNEVRSEFRQLLASGAQLKPAGEARDDPSTFGRRKYWPQFKLELFGTRFYLTAPRTNPAVRFFVAYVIPAGQSGHKLQIFPRIFYKDLSLVWRAASHLVASDEEFWIGKGEVRIEIIDGYEFEQSVESTTDLPLEMQTALEALNKSNKKAPKDDEVLQLVLRNAPRGRIRPYRDFTGPKELAASNPRNRIHRGKPIATFTRRNDPSSLRFVTGFEPDFRSGGRRSRPL